MIKDKCTVKTENGYMVIVRGLDLGLRADCTASLTTDSSVPPPCEKNYFRHVCTTPPEHDD